MAAAAATFDDYRAEAARRFAIIEGSVDDAEQRFLADFVRRTGVRRALEVGFNGGLSAAVMLAAAPELRLVSFDLGQHGCVAPAKALVDELFPGRHALVLGDSRATLPAYRAGAWAADAGAEPFDMAFIDGGHFEPVPRLDLANALPMLRPGAWVVVDDYCQAYGAHGVIQAYDDAVAAGELATAEGPHEGGGGRAWIVARKLPLA